MNRFLQTIIFFALAVAMIAFIFSALRPAQYLAESEFLVVSNNIEANCDKELGATLARIILSESFQESIKNTNHDNRLLENLNDNLKVKNYKSTNIVNVKIGGASLANTQDSLMIIQESILKESHKYYSLEDKIEIKTLINPRMIRTPRIIMENTAIGLIVGFILGLIITLSTRLRFDILRSSKGAEIKQKKTIVKEGKVIRESKSEKDYKAIIKKKLEKELSKDPIENLNLTDEGYVFKGTVEDFRKSLTDSKETKGAVIEKNDKKQTPKVRVISASTMIVSGQSKKIKKNKAPENLPVFIEKKLPVDNGKQETPESFPSIPSGEQDSNSVVDNGGEVSKKKEETKISEPNIIKTGLNKLDKEMTKVPGSKKASAHDIANGFAPDTKSLEGPSNEEIKDRLNKLLRGEL